MALPGTGGTLFPSRYLSAGLEHDLHGLVTPARTERTRRRFVRWWNRVESTCGPATGLLALFDLFAMPFASLLGFGFSDLRFDVDLATATLETPRRASVALVLHGWSSRPPKAWRELVRAADAAGAAWCLLAAPPHVSLVDARGRAARRNLDLSFPDALAPESFSRWWWLFRAAAFEPGRLRPPGSREPGRLITPIDRLLERAAAHQDAVGIDLQRGVEHALGALVGMRNARSEAVPSPGIDEALTLVYRILFLLFAESRDLVPTRHPVYEGSYSLSTLCRDALGPTHPAGLWEALAAVTRLARRGCRIDDLVVSPFNGRLFARRSAPSLEGRTEGRRHRAKDDAMRRALVALGSRPGRGGREEITYADLGVEELGAIYERVLDIDPTALVTDRPPAPRRRLSPRSHSSQRKETGTFYTPRALTEFVVRRTLEPLVDGMASERILSLRVLDPAMGSGAFLVAACRFLASAYERALVDEGQLGESDLDDDGRANIRRLVAERCLAGVDDNPVAVELARLSIWLTTLAQGKPLGFLDHRLRVGNSLAGASPDDLGRIPTGRRTSQDLPLFASEEFGEAMARLSRPLGDLFVRHDDSVADVHAKERLWAEVTGPRSPVDRWRRACSLWCAQWLRPRSHHDPPASAPELRAAIDALVRRDRTLPASRLERLLAGAEAAARDWNLFHWPLEFPDVFYGADGGPRDDPGFDAVLGNPPWEMLRKDPRSGSSSQDSPAHRGPTTPRSREQLTRFIRQSGIYEDGARGHLNLYQPFLERALSLTRRGGRVGLVLPWGLASDDGAAGLRAQLLDRHRLETLVGFDNGRGLFPIHRGLRFLVAVASKGRRTEVVRARFGVQSAAEIDALPGRDDPLETAYPVRLTTRLLRVTGGSRRRLPDARRPGDLRLADALMQTLPALGSPRGWGLRFGRELNATEDRSLFSDSGLPVIEGKHIRPFEVDFTDVRHHISSEAAERALGRGRVARPRLAYRDVSGTANRLSLIAAVVPAGVATSHTLFCLRNTLPPEKQHFLAALFNSLVLNAIVRLFMGQHVTTGLVEDLPAPLWTGSPEQARLAGLSAARSRRGPVPGLNAELQAAVARLYGIDAKGFVDLFAGFPLIEPSFGHAVAAILSRPPVAL